MLKLKVYKVKTKLLILAITALLQFWIFYFFEIKAAEMLNPSLQYHITYHIPLVLDEPYSFKLSHNNKYLAYINGEDRFQIIDLTKNQLFHEQTIWGTNGRIAFFEWFPDHNSLFCIVRQEDGPFQVYTLDLDMANKEDILPRFERVLPASIQKVLQVEISTHTNNLYLSGMNDHMETELYRIDIMKNINRIESLSKSDSIRSITVVKKSGSLLMDTTQGTKSTILSVRGQEKSKLWESNNDVLIGNTEEHVLLGKLNGDQLEEVFTVPLSNTEVIGSPTPLWQGRIPFSTALVQMVTPDQKVLLMDKERLDAIYPDGRHKVFRLKETNIISTLGNMYLEVKINKDKITYVWYPL